MLVGFPYVMSSHTRTLYYISVCAQRPRILL
jgi:hypothetical protein